MIWERVAQVLLSRAWITRSQLVEARRTQGFFGGSLVSHLLRLGYVDEAHLGEALGEVFGVPFAGPERFRVLEPDLRTSIPEPLVERHRVFPLQAEGKRLAVAMADPRDRTALRELQAATGKVIEPWVASEYRLAQALDRHYRIRPSTARSIAVARGPMDRPAPTPVPEPLPLDLDLDLPEPGLDGRPLHAAAEGRSVPHDVPEPGRAGERSHAAPELGLDGRPLDAPTDPFDPGLHFRELALEFADPDPPFAAHPGSVGSGHESHASRAESPVPAEPRAPRAESFAPAERRAPRSAPFAPAEPFAAGAESVPRRASGGGPTPPLGGAREAPSGATLEELEDELVAAADRDALAAALIAFCTARTRRAALFAVGKDVIRGVHGSGRGMEAERVRAVSVPRGGATILDTALASKDFYYGVVPQLPANRDLYSVLGGTLPSAVLVLPVVVKERVAALLYLDEADRPLTRPDIPLMRRVAAKAGLGFEMLLLRTKLRDI